MKNLKRVLIVLSLICVVGLGTTYALMSSTTNTAVNTFTSSKNVKIDLREPGWDGYTFDEALPAKPGETVKPVKPGEDADMSLGFNQAKNYQPMDVITKNPTVKNTSTTTDCFAAIKVEFEGPNGVKMTKKQFEDAYGKLTMKPNTSFVEIPENEIAANQKGEYYSLFFHENILSTEQTETLFTDVILNEDILLENGALPEFKIKTTGYATQANIGQQAAKAELIRLSENQK